MPGQDCHRRNELQWVSLFLNFFEVFVRKFQDTEHNLIKSVHGFINNDVKLEDKQKAGTLQANLLFQFACLTRDGQ